MARRVGVAAAGQRQAQREGVGRVEEQRQAGRRVEPAADEADRSRGRPVPPRRPVPGPTSRRRTGPPPRGRDLLRGAGAADQADDEGARLAHGDRAVAELERLVGARRDLARLGQLQAPLRGDAGRRAAAQDDDPAPVGLPETPADRGRRLDSDQQPAPPEVRPRARSSPADAGDDRRSGARACWRTSGSSRSPPRLPRRDQGHVGARRQGAAGATGDRDRRVAELADPIGDRDGLRRGAGPRDDDDRLGGRVAADQDARGPQQDLGERRRDDARCVVSRPRPPRPGRGSTTSPPR